MALTSASCCWYISSSCLRPVRPSCLDATASCTAPEVKALHTHQPTMTSNMGALNFAVPEAHMHKRCNDLSHDDLEYNSTMHTCKECSPSLLSSRSQQHLLPAMHAPVCHQHVPEGFVSSDVMLHGCQGGVHAGVQSLYTQQQRAQGCNIAPWQFDGSNATVVGSIFKARVPPTT